MALHSRVHAYYFGTILDNIADKYQYGTWYKNNLDKKWYLEDILGDSLRKTIGFNKALFALNVEKVL